MIEGFSRSEFTDGDVTRAVYQAGTGPAVVVIHELPGITPEVIGFARKVAARGMTVALPDLIGVPGKRMSLGYNLASMTTLCVRREFQALASDRSSPITSWLRALARDLHARCGG